MKTSINAAEIPRDVIVMGASAGGIEAVMEVLSRLPYDLPATIGVVIHRGAKSPADWSEMLGARARLRVVEPADGDPLLRATVYVAPSDVHMLFEAGCVRLDHGHKHHHTRPAADPLFSSAALAYGSRVVGVVLTGGGEDGLQGLLAISGMGGIALAQSPFEAECAAMPINAIAGDHVEAALKLDDIGDTLALLARGLSVPVATGRPRADG